jgi:ATP-binding cassette subfamily F protein uup
VGDDHRAAAEVEQRVFEHSTSGRAKTAALQPAPDKPKKRRLSFKEMTELAALPDRIDALERDRVALYASLGDPAVLRDGSAVVAAKSRLAEIESALTALIQRWEALETIAAEA